MMLHPAQPDYTSDIQTNKQSIKPEILMSTLKIHLTSIAVMKMLTQV